MTTRHRRVEAANAARAQTISRAGKNRGRREAKRLRAHK
jgi:hypothetical protein